MNLYQYENDLPESWEVIDQEQKEKLEYFKMCYEEDQYFAQFED